MLELRAHVIPSCKATWAWILRRSGVGEANKAHCLLFFREIGCLILSHAFGNPSLGERSKGNIFPHTVPLWAPFLSCWEHAALRLLPSSIRKENNVAEAHLLLICCCLVEGEAAPCKTLAKLQIHHRPSAVSRPVHKQLP